MEGGLRADSSHQIDLFRVDESLVLVLIIFFTNRDPCQARTLVSQKCDDGSSINAGDGWHALPRTPLAQALDSSPVRVFFSSIGNHHTAGLDVGALEVFEQVIFVPHSCWNTVVAD